MLIFPIRNEPRNLSNHNATDIVDAANDADVLGTLALTKKFYADAEAFSLESESAVNAASDAVKAARVAFNKLLALRVPTKPKTAETAAVDALRYSLESVHKSYIAFHELFYFVACEGDGQR